MHLCSEMVKSDGSVHTSGRAIHNTIGISTNDRQSD